jgi:hypothetical protein
MAWVKPTTIGLGGFLMVDEQADPEIKPVAPLFLAVPPPKPGTDRRYPLMFLSRTNAEWFQVRNANTCLQALQHSSHRQHDASPAHTIIRCCRQCLECSRHHSVTLSHTQVFVRGGLLGVDLDCEERGLQNACLANDVASTGLQDVTLACRASM